MNKKSDCELAIRQLIHDWVSSNEMSSEKHPNFVEFKGWLRDQGYGHYLEFIGVMAASDVSEKWFEQELKQTWRN